MNHPSPPSPANQASPATQPASELLLYQTEDGRTRIDCRLDNNTLWLSQAQMAQLFQVTVPTVNEHLKSIYAEGELNAGATIRNFRIVALEGMREVAREITHYNLDGVLAVGFRVRGHRGTQFRQWATARLGEYLVHGVSMDDERLKNPAGKGEHDYFDTLLARIRDIRSSERRFYQKVLDIYATSIDYTPDAQASQQFFATVQNKMHWAAHGHTAAEVIALRADATQAMMGLQATRTQGVVRKDDVGSAKNYLSEPELQVLNRVVSLYLEFAELQALERKPMAMRDWVSKLDDFLKLSGRAVLEHAGSVSSESAKIKAEAEYVQFRKQLDALPQPVDVAFEALAQATTQSLKNLPAKSRAPKTRTSSVNTPKTRSKP